MTDVSDFIIVLRATVISLGLICFVWCLIKMSANWNLYDRVGRALAMHHTTSAFAMTWAASEAIVLHSPNGLRSVFFLFSLGNLIAGLWWSRGTSFYLETNARRHEPWGTH